MFLTIVVFLLVLSVLVLVHEAGHFFVAKKLGVKVEEFGFGFPPRIFGIKFGETLYSLNLLPIGGFVKLYGEDEAGGGSVKVTSHKSSIRQAQYKQITKDKRSFVSRSVWQRASIVVAGVIMNFLLALVIISYLFAVVGVATTGPNVEIASVIKNSPAGKSGLKPGDIILSVDGIKVSDPEQIISYTKKHLGQQTSLLIKSTNGKSKTIEVTPRLHYPSNEGAMGIAIGNTIIVKKYPWYQAPIVGLKETLSETWLIVQGLGGALGQLIFAHSVPKDVAGPIGIAQLTGQTIKVGYNAVFSLVALLSLNLAIMNILPIPALDGGRLFFILIEAVTRRKVHPKFEGYAHAIGMAILLTLVALISFNDVYKWLMHQPLIP